ncbi:M48 family metalloprotease [Natrialbaceae archaeon GCM10025810]|uniref:M48 family metalloprotease n=1 Tax=Halovalidus salilacus TaxID=3075124 RepID=UPI0036228522
MITTVAVVLAITVVPFVAFRAYARRVEGLDEPVEVRVHRLDRAQQAGGFLLPFVGVVGLAELDATDRVLAFFDAVAPRFLDHPALEFVLIVAVVFAFATAPLIAVTLGTYSTLRSLRETSASPWRQVKGVLAVMAITAVSVGVGIGGYLAITSVLGSTQPVIVGAVGVVIVASFTLTPYLVAIFQERVPLEGDRRERVEQLCADLGYRPRGLSLLEGASTRVANALVAGTIPGVRYVFLTDYLLEEFDDDEVRAILAHEFGHVAGHHLWQRALLTVAAVVTWVLAAEHVGLAVLEKRFGLAGVAFPIAIGYGIYHVSLLGGLAYRQEYRADAYAARAAGVDATVSALEKIADSNDMRRDAGLLYALATHHPPIDDRIDAVRRLEDAEPPRDGSTEHERARDGERERSSSSG